MTISATANDPPNLLAHTTITLYGITMENYDGEPAVASTTAYLNTLQRLSGEGALLSACVNPLAEALLSFPITTGLATFWNMQENKFLLRKATIPEENEEMGTLHVRNTSDRLIFQASTTHHISSGARNFHVYLPSQPIQMATFEYSDDNNSWNYLPKVDDLPSITASRLIAISSQMHAHTMTILEAGPSMVELLQTCLRQTMLLCIRSRKRELHRTMGSFAYHAKVDIRKEQITFALQSPNDRVANAETTVQYYADQDNGVVLDVIDSGQLNSEALSRLERHLTGSLFSRFMFEYFE